MKFFPSTALSLAALAAAGLLSAPARAATQYTCCNIWYRSPDRISAVNHKEGSILPAGSPVEVVRADGDRIVFRTTRTRGQFTLTLDHQDGLDAQAVRERFIGDRDFMALTAGLTAREVELIRDGRIEEGMSRAAVLISFGPPPPHRTPSLDAATWTYWARDEFAVEFDAEGRLKAGPHVPARRGDAPPAAVETARGNPPTAAAAATTRASRYTACNIWYTRPDRIDSVNYQTGSILPAGTPVHDLQVEREGVTFHAAGQPAPFRMIASHLPRGAGAASLLDRFFTTRTPDELTDGLSPREKELIRAARIEAGMSKRAVAIALGLPPPHHTPSLSANEWTYWGTQAYTIRFDAAGLLLAGPQVAQRKAEPAAPLPAVAPTTPPAVAAAAPAAPAAAAPAAVAPAPAAPPVAATPAPVLAADGKCWAVVVGIAEYEHAGSGALVNLSFADDDAEAFAGALRNQGWPASHVKLLVNKDATLRNIMVTLESWLTKSGPDDMIVLFWSGHGFPDPEDPEKVYFACYDTDITIPATGYRMDRVHTALAERKARNVIVFADTCHAGKLMTRGEKGLSIVTHLEKLRAQNAVPKGWIFMVGADSDRQAIEHTSWSNGAFTHCLLEGLAGAADGFESAGEKDGKVTMNELRAFVSSAMPEETQKVLGSAKHPIITTSSGDPAIWDLTLLRRDSQAAPEPAPQTR